MFLDDNKGNQIILSHATWETFIVKYINIEKLMQSTVPASLSIRDLVIKLIKICNTDIVKLTLRDTCMYMKPATILFLFTFKHCIEHVYFDYVRVRTWSVKNLNNMKLIYVKIV